MVTPKPRNPGPMRQRVTRNSRTLEYFSHTNHSSIVPCCKKKIIIRASPENHHQPHDLSHHHPPPTNQSSHTLTWQKQPHSTPDYPNPHGQIFLCVEVLPPIPAPLPLAHRRSSIARVHKIVRYPEHRVVRLRYCALNAYALESITGRGGR
jgi:hypothetical protein